MSKEQQGSNVLIERLNSLEDKFRLALCASNYKTALDVGCGSGMFVKKLEKRGIRSYGIDICNSAFLSDVDTLLVADVESLPFEDESFDFVTSHSVLHEVDPLLAINEMTRVLKIGGTLNIIDVAMILDQGVILKKRLTRIKQQILRRFAFAVNSGIIDAVKLSTFLRSEEWKQHRQLDKITTLESLEEIKRDLLPTSDVGSTGYGVLAYLNWIKK